jgi:hypothetical protein
VYERDLEDWEYPEPDDETEDASTTIICLGCGAAIYDDSVQCPYCGDYVTTGTTSAFSGRPWWFVVLAAAGIVAVIVWLVI